MFKFDLLHMLLAVALLAAIVAKVPMPVGHVDSDPAVPAKWEVIDVGKLRSVTPPSGERTGDFYWTIDIDGTGNMVPFYEGPLDPVVGETYELQRSLDNGGRQQFRLKPHLVWKDCLAGKLISVSKAPTYTEVRLKTAPPYKVGFSDVDVFLTRDYQPMRPYTFQRARWNGRSYGRLVPSCGRLVH